MGSDALSRLGDSKYLLVTTFRRDGTPVSTPVWVVRDGDRLLFGSAAQTGKIKRIRNSGRVELASCDLRGNPSGDTVKGTAVLLDQGGVTRVRTLLGRKYGLIGRVTMLGGRIRRGANGTAAVSIDLTP
ncbi:MAG: PPOX class F420-dependent oxidoreductase [Actinomycetota bacterium]|nr:PPOX class F420-dependent oxidoreductase [Actinomycetota bacterium]